MNFKKLGVKLKKYLPLVILAIVIIGVLVVVIFGNNPSNNAELDNGSLPTDSSSDKIDDNSSQNDKPSTSNSSSSLTNNVLKDGIYNCEFMYEGKSLEDDEVIKSWFQRLATFNIYDFPDDFNYSYTNLKNELFGGADIYITKENDWVWLYFSNGVEVKEYVNYDMNNKKFAMSTVYRNEFKKEVLENFFNTLINISYDKDSFTFGNYGSSLVYFTVYNNYIKNHSTDDLSLDKINFEYDKYSGLGDLVCKTSN